MIKFILLSLFAIPAFAAYTPGSVVSRDYAPKITTINTIVSKSANYTATVNDETIVFTATSTLSLPAASTVKGKKFEIVATGSGVVVTVDPNSTETVCGQTTILLDAATNFPDQIEIQSDGTNWIGLKGACIRRKVADVSCSTSSSITAQQGAFVSAIGNRSGSTCSLTLASGMCSTTPMSGAHAPDTAANANYRDIGWSSTTAGNISCINGTAGCATNFSSQFWISCAR